MCRKKKFSVSVVKERERENCTHVCIEKSGTKNEETTTATAKKMSLEVKKNSA